MNLEQQFKQTLKKINLKKSDRILVAISGGKDSTTTAYLLKKFGYDIEAIFIDLCVDNYSKKCLKLIQEFCRKFEIKLHIYELKKEQGRGMKYFWARNKNLNHCAVCGVFKKWILNREARRMKFDYIATGHNLDDEVETNLLNICKGSLQLSLNSGIVSRNAKDKKFVSRIKPLFYSENTEIKIFAEKKGLKFMKGVCPYREDSYRVEIRNFAKQLSKKQKLNILKNAEKLQKEVKKKSSEINYCKICNEPARGKICKRCGLVVNQKPC